MNDEQGQDLDFDDKILQEEQDISTADAVSLFNTSLAKALAQQKEDILGEIRKTQSAEPVPPGPSTSVKFHGTQYNDSHIEIRNFLDTMKRFYKSSRAANQTNKKYNEYFKKFKEWCIENHCQYLPALFYRWPCI
ncbi:uncharacterized protein LOC133183439 [Saccostrea echinata]|uniref:uncharacterized protein LOC133183439 n=1 Tax=Saccostrea echinata TaxID=191078 RepID=UPI002A7F1EC1|nr:uncharacterized protein LOC133183439 [Saccostrea echinata]